MERLVASEVERLFHNIVKWSLRSLGLVAKDVWNSSWIEDGKFTWALSMLVNDEFNVYAQCVIFLPVLM